MGRGLCVTVLMLQVACTLQAPATSPNTNPMVDMMRHRAQDARGMYDLQENREDDIASDMRDYMEYHHIEDDDEEPFPSMLRQSNARSERIITWYKLKQNGDMVIKSIIHDLLTSTDGPSDFAKKYLLKSVMSDSEPGDGKKQIAAMLLRHLMANPSGENSEVAKRLMYHLLSMMDDHGKSALRMNILNMMSFYHGEELELLTNFFHYMMRDDIADEMESREALLLLIQHFMSMQYFDTDKMSMTMQILRDLSSREDNQGQGILRNFISHMITAGNRAVDVSNKEQWKFDAPGPCLVEDRFGNIVNKSYCPNDFSCNVGPANYNFNNRNQRYTMCAYPPEHFMFHACEVTYPEGKVERRPESCESRSTCNFGPFTMSSGDRQHRVKFCSNYANNTGNFSSLNPVARRACAFEDEKGFRTMQRVCPQGMKCAGGKFPVMIDNKRQYATVCHPSGDHSRENRQDFMPAMMNALMGFGYDFSSMESMDLNGNYMASNIDNIMARSVGSWNFGIENSLERGNRRNDRYMDDDQYNREHNEYDWENRGENNRTNGEMSDEFFNFIIATVMHDQQREERDDEALSMMNDRESDVKVFRILRYLVFRLAEDQPLLVEFVKGFMEKYQLGVLEDVDRIFMHGIIRYLFAFWNHQQRDGQQQMGYDASNIFEFMKYNMEHERIQDNLEDAWRQMNDREMVRRRQQQGGDFMEMLKYMQQQQGSDANDFLNLMRYTGDKRRQGQLDEYRYMLKDGNDYRYNFNDRDMYRPQQQQQRDGWFDTFRYMLTRDQGDQRRDMEEQMRGMYRSMSDSDNMRSDEIQMMRPMMQRLNQGQK